MEREEARDKKRKGGGNRKVRAASSILKRYKVGQWRRSAIICRGRCWTILHRITAAHRRTRERKREGDCI